MNVLSKTNMGQVAKPLPHDAAKLHVTGTARYVDDIPTPRGCLHLAFGLSPIAKGIITAMDLDAVRSSPGVVAVLTADDLPFANDVSPSAHDEPLLSDGTVNHLGQPVFLVVATSHRAARVAARKGQIDYQEQDALLTLDQALAADSRFEEGPRIYEKGDASAAIDLRGARGLDLDGQAGFYKALGRAAAVEGLRWGGSWKQRNPTWARYDLGWDPGHIEDATLCRRLRQGG